MVGNLTRRDAFMGLAVTMATFAGWGSPARARAPLSLTTGMREPWTNPAGTGFTDLLVADLLRRMGLSGTVSVNLAASRAIRLADDGIDDGLAARIAGLEKAYPNLLRVPEPIFDNDFVACSLGLTFDTTEWASLSPYGIGHIIGWQVFERNLPQVREVTLAKDSNQLMALLKAQRVEVILHERWQALWAAREQGLVLTVHEPPLARVPMFIYLHARHAALIPSMSSELAAMKADGTYDRIASRAFADLGVDPGKRSAP